jgi:hypothetical protein
LVETTEVSKEVTVRIFRDEELRQMRTGNQRDFTCRLGLLFNAEDGSNMFLRDIEELLPEYTSYCHVFLAA